MTPSRSRDVTVAMACLLTVMAALSGSLANADPMRPLDGGRNGSASGEFTARLGDVSAGSRRPASGNPAGMEAVSLRQPGHPGSGDANPGSGAAGPVDATEDPNAERRLQAIRTNPDGQRRALIGSHWLRAGDRVEGLRIVAIADNHIVLTQGRDRRTVYLVPPLQVSKLPAPDRPVFNESRREPAQRPQ